MKQTSFFEVVGENSAQVYEKSSVRKLKENLKAPEEGSIKSWPSHYLKWCACPDLFFYKFIYRVELRLLCSSLSNMAWVSDIQGNGAWAEREGEEGLSFFSFPPTLTLLESLTLWPFYVWCALILNQDPTVRLLQPCGHVRTGYETGYLQPFDFNCNVVNTPLDEL